MRVRVLNEETGEFESGHIADVIDKGVQPVYRMTLADGKQITLTENHRVLTAEGWRRMRDALGLTGDGDEARMTRSCRLLVNGMPVHANAMAGSPCGMGLTCDGMGNCIGCIQPSDCGVDTFCQAHTCTLGIRGVNIAWAEKMRSKIAGRDIWMSGQQLMDEGSGIVDRLIRAPGH